eukprot:COSAG03_NODE_22809_length_286_cov_1.598930_1_plen_36_part_01
MLRSTPAACTQLLGLHALRLWRATHGPLSSLNTHIR